MDAAHPVPVPSAPASWRWSRLVPPEPLALQNPAYFDIGQPPATQTSGSYYSTERATKRHFHNGTSHFASVLPPSPRARPNMWRVPDARPWPTTTGLPLLCECQLVTITCTVGVANAEKRYFLIVTVEDRRPLAFAQRWAIFTRFLFIITFSGAIPLVRLAGRTPAE